MKMPEAVNMAKLFTQATAEKRAPGRDQDHTSELEKPRVK